VLFLAAALFIVLCLYSYDPRDPSFNVVTSRVHVSNLCGLVGSHVADAMVQLLGVSALVVPLILLIIAVRNFAGSSRSLVWAEVVSVIFVVAAASGLLERQGTGRILNFPTENPGGALGSFVHAACLKFLGSGGEILLVTTVFVLCFLRLSGLSFRGVWRVVLRAGTAASDLTFWLVDRLRKARLRRALYAEVDTFPEYDESAGREWDADLDTEKDDDVLVDARIFRDELPRDEPGGSAWRRLSFLPEDETPSALPERQKEVREESINLKTEQDGEAPRSPARKSLWQWLNPFGRKSKKKEHVLTEQQTEHSLTQKMPADSQPGPQAEQAVTEQEMEAAIDAYLRNQASAAKRAARSRTGASATGGKAEPAPVRVEQRADVKTARPKKQKTVGASRDQYKFPSTDLVDAPPRSERAVDEKLLERNAQIVERKLADLGVKGTVVAIHPGPVITMYELELAPGIPLRKILNMSDDLAMALKSGSTRVVAPIPGKDTVGIEVPNLNREIVHFREIVESPVFMKSKNPLKMALGKRIDGEPFATSLIRMPHLLIAGATGTGKSVGLNCLICSWLMSCHPDDLKLLLVDPKKLELSHYQDIPHLLHPVVTDPEKVPAVLGWAIREMERRYDLLSRVGAKSIASYNEKVASGKIPVAEDEDPPEKLPYIVLIVDELAELMMVAAKDIEISIARLAQMARASGIHLILATQRPSVDVITGIIKANFPARLSFQVSAKADSRTILDTVGAEHLLGMGDMLFLPPGVAKLKRLHGAFISEDEIKRIVDFVKAQRQPVYLQEISEHVSKHAAEAGAADLVDDPKYDEAVELVTRLGHASISLIQRHMRIGYNRAARIIEGMEAEGIVGPSDGTSRPREVIARSLGHIPDSL
jgi:S-DNA-T family DNA segregation ATPase FtsK/SpoIIIE